VGAYQPLLRPQHVAHTAIYIYVLMLLYIYIVFPPHKKKEPEKWEPINHSCDPNTWLVGLNTYARYSVDFCFTGTEVQILTEKSVL